MLNTNSRFWVYVNNGWVRLTLRPGESCEWHTSCATDEGWRSEYRSWANDGSAIVSEFVTRERDCDGLFDRCGESECPLTELQSRSDEYTDGLSVPAWRSLDARQRDYSAEAAGY
jgi:hypothetical protein